MSPRRTETEDEKVDRLEARADLLNDIRCMKAAIAVLDRRGSHKMAEQARLRVLDWEEQAERMSRPMVW